MGDSICVGLACSIRDLMPVIYASVSAADDTDADTDIPVAVRLRCSILMMGSYHVSTPPLPSNVKRCFQSTARPLGSPEYCKQYLKVRSQHHVQVDLVAGRDLYHFKHSF